jgi:pimeloyl-ACP methyl ester carboxylesterase
MSRLVVTVHGIRTFGNWQERLESLLVRNDVEANSTNINYKFGYFSVIAFLVPLFRWLVVRRFRRFLVLIVESNTWDRIDLVGHSFGTHVIAWALYGIPAAKRPKIHTLIFAGSVLKSSFP